MSLPTDPYREGYDVTMAYWQTRQGHESENPYSEGTFAHDDWERGAGDADDDYDAYMSAN